MSGQVAEEIKEERKNKIMQLQQEISLRKNQALIGKDFEVIIEKEMSQIYMKLEATGMYQK